jgi:predicted nucleotidyltransferase component of viral defense system
MWNNKDMLNIEEWVSQSNRPAIKEFRQAIHTVLVAISHSKFLQAKMVMKGGVLLAIRFKGLRHTRDIDFSTSEQYDIHKEEKIIRTLREELSLAIELLDYGLDCRIQSFSINPKPLKNPSFPTLTIKIGYAYKGSRKQKKLMEGKCPDVLEIDYSYNEINQEIDILEFQKGNKIKAYSISDLVAEKYRAIIQQKSRNRIRRQDAFDIYWLLKNGDLEGRELKKSIHNSLIIKAESRDLIIGKNSLNDEEIIRRSQVDYKNLAQEIEGELPPFDEVFHLVNEYYTSLPWN